MKNFTVNVDATILVLVDAENEDDAITKVQDILKENDVENILTGSISELIDFSDIWIGSAYLVTDNEAGEDL